jgi:hypothetical protein
MSAVQPVCRLPLRLVSTALLACVLVVCLWIPLPLPVAASGLLVNSAGSSLSGSLRLNGVDVGAVLASLVTRVDALESSLTEQQQINEQQQIQIDELLRRNATSSGGAAAGASNGCLPLLLNIGSGGALAAVSPDHSPGCEVGSYVVSAVVSLTVTANANYAFAGWSGGITSGSPSIDFTMPPSYSILTANFDAVCYPLMVSAGIGGSITALSPTHSPGCAPGTYAAASAVSVAATSIANFRFDAWSGVLTNSNPSLTFSMPAATTSLTANFAVVCYALQAGYSFGGFVSALTPTHSQYCPDGYYYASANISITAFPKPNFAFGAWSGASTATSAAVTFSMPAAASFVKANFAAICYVLTVDAPSFTLSPESSVGCVAGSFYGGESLSVTTPVYGIPDHVFVEWSGVASSTTTDVLFDMPSSAATLTARFAPYWSLSVTPVVGGSGSASLVPDRSDGCPQNSYVAGAVVSITPMPNQNWLFLGWSGAVNSTNSPLTFTMPDNAVSITATFARCWVLSTTSSPGGAISALSPPNSPGCGTHSYFAGTSISVTALPSDNYSFTSWSGDATGTTAALTFTMPNKEAGITAYFQVSTV